MKDPPEGPDKLEWRGREVLTLQSDLERPDHSIAIDSYEDNETGPEHVTKLGPFDLSPNPLCDKLVEDLEISVVREPAGEGKWNSDSW